MPRYIDADEAKRIFLDCAAQQLRLDRIGDARAMKQAADCLDGIPTADVAPVVHAHWIKKIHEWDLGDPPYDYTDFTCSKCKIRVQNKTSFCPDCGAKMDEEKTP